MELLEEETLHVCIDRKRRIQGLGITIAGGNGSSPYKDDDGGIFIARIAEGGAAEEVGLRVEDKIVSINGVECADLDHYQVANILKNCRTDLMLSIRRMARRKVSIAAPLVKNVGPLIRSRSRSSSHLAHPPHPPQRSESPPVPPQRRYSLSSSQIPLDSTGVHFHPYCFACNPSVVHLTSGVHSHPLPSLPPLPLLRPLPLVPPIPPHASDSNSMQLRPYSRHSSKLMDVNPNAEIITIRLQRDNNGLGFIVSSGDQRLKRSPKVRMNSKRFNKLIEVNLLKRLNSIQGVYVSAIVKDGSADRDGQLSIGDRILSVIGCNFDFKTPVKVK